MDVCCQKNGGFEETISAPSMSCDQLHIVNKIYTNYQFLEISYK